MSLKILSSSGLLIFPSGLYASPSVSLLQIRLLMFQDLTNSKGRFTWQCITECMDIMITKYFPSGFSFESISLQKMIMLMQFIQDVIPFSTSYEFSFHKYNTKL
jgi:hypothetical protein